MVSVGHWTGRETRALRHALRLSVRSFAEHLGVATRTVAKWEALAGDTSPRPDNQAILDTALRTADTDACARFEWALWVPSVGRNETSSAAQPWCDREAWSDDIDRALIALSRQEFRSTSTLLERWLQPYSPEYLDHRGWHLRARSLMLLGDMRRFRGHLRGPESATSAYDEAHTLFRRLDSSRRVAQVEMARAITTEMCGEVRTAASMYKPLAIDERLREYERAQARLWIGTSLTKAGNAQPAMREIEAAGRAFEFLGEEREWAVAQQKYALALVAAGDIGGATNAMDLATSHSHEESPLEQVQRQTASGHVFSMDRATTGEAVAILDRAHAQASKHGLAHQLRWIDKIRQLPERMTWTTRPPRSGVS